MRSLSWPLRLYILLVTALALGAVSFSILALGSDASSWIALFVIAGAIGILDNIPIDLYGEQVEVTLSSAVKFAAVLLYPAPVVTLGTFVGTILGEVPAKRPWFKKLFNVSVMTVTWLVVAWFYLVSHEPNVDFFGSLQNIFALILSGLTDYVINSVFVALVISLAARLSFRYILWRNYRQIVWHELSMIPLGAFLAVLWRYNPASIVLAGLPLFVVRQSFKVANDLQRQTRDALHALVRVVDERDHHTFDHSDRVSNYARMIAEALDLPQEEIEVIAPAALLHDLGKVGMADDILFNPKILNPEERKDAQRHAQVGAMLLSKFPLFDKGAVLVKHHHERYDGTGYPDGMKGDEIPVGSRIISVADAYQAMTEERPYRRALSRDEAIAQLIQGSGSQFDPQVVQAFQRVLQGQSEKEKQAPVIVPQPAKA